MRRRRATVQWRHLVNWREAARCGEWAQQFSNASCFYSVDNILIKLQGLVGTWRGVVRRKASFTCSAPTELSDRPWSVQAI